MAHATYPRNPVAITPAPFHGYGTSQSSKPKYRLHLTGHGPPSKNSEHHIDSSGGPGRFARRCIKLAISEFPKWRKYLILLSFLDNSSARPVQIGGVDVNICHSRSTAVRGRRRSSSQSPPRGPFCRTRTGPVEADGAVDAQNAPTAPWKTLCVFHELPQGLSHQVTHEKLRKAPKYRWETRIDPLNWRRRVIQRWAE